MTVVHSPPASSSSMQDSLRTLEAQVAARAAADADSTARMTALETEVAAMRGQIGGLGSAMEEVLRRLPAPAAAAAAAAAAATPDAGTPTLLDFGLDEDELQEVAADDCATITNANVAKERPDIEACAKAMAAGSAGVRAAAVPSGGPGLQLHVSDRAAAPLLERWARGKAGRQGSLVAVVNDSQQLVLTQAPGGAGNGRQLVSEKQLLELIPNPFVFINMVSFRKKDLVAEGYLHGKELVAYEQVFEPELFLQAQSFVGGYELLSPEDFQRNWQVFLVFEREVMFEIYERRLSFASLHMHLHGNLMHRAMLRAAVRSQGGAAGGGGASSKGGAAAGGGGAAKGNVGMSHATFLATQVPEQYRDACCVPFWRTGRCNRSECTHAATGHKCLRCGSAMHGGGQCKA